MRRILSLFLAVLAVLVLVGPSLAAAAAGAAAAKKVKPKVEVVFCLDTTGSMTGLIDGAKQKIWAICNQIANGKPVPDLKVGLVAFRDKGDEYITKVIDLTDDLDAIHGQLKKFVAAGGGDTPESVNQALDDSVNKIKWSSDKKTLRIIFLVGDAPPHMDYTDDVKYPVTCKKACEKGIIINTIQCGSDPQCTRYWKDIALKAEGSFAAIPQKGGVTVVSTPFDKELATLNTKLTKTVLVWGDRRQQEADGKKNMDALGLSRDGAASRVACQAKNGQVASYCLLDSIKQGKVKLETIKKEELPEPLKKLTLREQKAYLAKLDKERTALNKQVLELDRKRADYIVKKQADEAKKGTASFDAKVLETLRNQAKKFEIAY
jgi:Mg-chelatase subunit ChlD